MYGLSWPFEGLPLVWEVLFMVAFAVITGMFLWTFALFVRALHAGSRPPRVEPEAVDEFLWVFIVPALNEEVTIADSVQRLTDVGVARKRILVVDDGSEDRTPEILAELRDPALLVIRREPPNAQLGKAAALNHAYRTLESLPMERDRVIVCIVDADGRLDPRAPVYAATHFADPGVAGVQALVRIYNRGSLLTWMQDIEFGVYGHLFQAGRNDWGTAGMGGNGQFNRLSALDEIVGDEDGPWRDKLTEDQDLGLRLIADGWEGRQDLRGMVSQQGIPSLRPLLRQRTRWSQGNLQAFGVAGKVMRAPIGLVPRLEQMIYLLMPLWQSIIGVSLLAAIGLAVFDVTEFWNGGTLAQLLFFYALTFGGTIMGCIASRSPEGAKGWVMGFLIGHIYAFYTWIIWPALLRAIARQLTSRDTWAKTKREAIVTPADRRDTVTSTHG